MTFKEAATLAKQGNVKKLILTHFGAALLNPEQYLLNASSIFNQTIIGKDRLTIQLKFPE